jgi:phage tail sheath gpL-like
VPTIDTGIPASIKRPGTFAKFLFSLAGRGLVPLAQRILLVGMKSSAGSATAEVPVQVFDDTDGDTKAGAGSELALMARKAFEQARMQGTQPEIWICPIAEPGSGTANTTTFTFTGPATADGNAIFRVAGRTLIIGVSSGDSASTVAGALEDLADTLAAQLPVTAGVAAGVVTFTHVTKGENGGDVDFEVVSLPSGLACVIATGAAGAGVTDITAALDASLTIDFDGIAIANRKSADVTDAKAHTATAWGYAQKRYRHIFLGDPTTLSAATTLGLAANDYTVVIVSCEGSPSLPGELAAAACCAVFGRERPNANYDHAKLALYPPAATSVYLATEQESALSSGVTPLMPTPEGDLLEVVRLVTTHTTTSSAPDLATFDLATSRTAAYIARQLDIRFRVDFANGAPDNLMVIDDDDPLDVRARVRDMIIGIHRDAEDLHILRDVDEFTAQIQVEEDDSVPGRLNVIDPFRVVSPLHQIAVLHRAYL